MSVLSNIASGLSSLGTSLVNSSAQSAENEKNRLFQARQNELAYQRQVELWRLNNDYNSPSNQMSRLSAAGVNPNLAYDGLSSTGSMPSVSTGGLSGSSETASFSDPMLSVLSTYQNMRQLDLNAAKTESEIEGQRIQNDLNSALANKALQDSLFSTSEREFFENTSDLRKQLLEAGLNETEARIALSRVERIYKLGQYRNLGYQTDILSHQAPDLYLRTGLENALLRAQTDASAASALLDRTSARNLALDYRFKSDTYDYDKWASFYNMRRAGFDARTAGYNSVSSKFGISEAAARSAEFKHLLSSPWYRSFRSVFGSSPMVSNVGSSVGNISNMFLFSLLHRR